MNDTAAHTGDFTSIQFTEDSVLGALTGAMENISDLVSDGTTFFPGTGHIYSVHFGNPHIWSSLL